MLQLDLWRFPEGDPQHTARLRSIVDEGNAIARQSKRAAVDHLTRSIGVSALATRNESYYGEALSYTLALVHAHLNDPEAAIEHLGVSNVLPFDGGDLIFSEAVARSLLLSDQQEAALERHVPSVFLSSMPRSASAALASTISNVFGCPIFRASIGRYPHYYLVPFWVNRLSRGGSVLHDHFGPGEFNRRTLDRCGIRKVFVMIRDPRAAAASFVQHSATGTGSMAVTEENVLRVFEMAYLPWLESWQEFASRPESPEIIWLRSNDVTNDEASLRSLMNVIVDTLTKTAPDWRPPDLSRVVLSSANFVTGSPDGWRGLVSKAGQERMWAKVPRGFREMLELQH